MLERISISFIWILVLSLLGLGLVMVASTSPWAIGVDEYELFTKQIIFAGGGLVFAIVAAILDYRKFQKYVKYIFILALIFLALCYVPGIRRGLNGEYRWIGIGPISFQPSEFAKLAIVLALAAWYAKYNEHSREFIKGFIIPGIILGFPLILIFFEKDMGTAAALAIAGCCIMFVGGTRIRYMIPPILLAMAGMFYMVALSGNRMARIEAWRDLEAHKLKAALQQYQSLRALTNGGLDGVGVGNSVVKHGYLPYAHTDFIYAPIGEELGLLGTLGVLSAFGFITLLGIILALKIKDTFGRLICIGIIFTLFCPALLNIAVVTAVLPNTGLPLPFISYGGSNLFFALIGIGIITSVQRWQTEPDGPYLDPRKRRTTQQDTTSQISL